MRRWLAKLRHFVKLGSKTPPWPTTNNASGRDSEEAHTTRGSSAKGAGQWCKANTGDLHSKGSACHSLSSTSVASYRAGERAKARLLWDNVCCSASHKRLAMLVVLTRAKNHWRTASSCETFRTNQLGASWKQPNKAFFGIRRRPSECRSSHVTKSQECWPKLWAPGLSDPGCPKPKTSVSLNFHGMSPSSIGIMAPTLPRKASSRMCVIRCKGRVSTSGLEKLSQLFVA